MAQGSIKLEIDQESYDRVHGQISALYDLSQKISSTFERIIRFRLLLLVVAAWAFLAGFVLCWLLFVR